MEINDKVVIITGASSGIGKATSEILHQKGAKIVLAARSVEKLNQISEKPPGTFVIPCDMTKTTDIDNLVDKTLTHFGRIDILINNAGQGYDASVESINLKNMHYIFDLNVFGPLVAMQKVIPHMRKEHQGAIINISSGLSLLNLPYMSPYASSKKALVSFSLAARQELKKDGIIVSVVYPYITDTDFEKNTLKSTGNFLANDSDEKSLPLPDPAGFAALKILEAINTEKPEIFAHQWMSA
jgi:short-subunit dehydrogenase